MPHLSILGIRGIPARHGGFETFAERLALHLDARGWSVTVYCQADGEGPTSEERWRGIRLVHVPVSQTGSLGTVVFDWKATRHAARERQLVLTLGYNTAVFFSVYRWKRVTNLVNMDGIEWRRAKWSRPVRAWFRANELLACRLADHLVADSPGIERHLARRAAAAKMTMIPYGADAIGTADPSIVTARGLEPGGYALVVARIEPENSILEIVSAFSRRARRVRLVVLGELAPDSNAYHARIRAAAGAQVVFLGAVYDQDVVAALRFHARAYVHGHQVGGTNPSLVEALGAGNAVLAYDNVFNRWVAGEGAAYFDGEESCAKLLDGVLEDDATLQGMAARSRARHAREFTWERVLGEYERLLLAWHARRSAAG